jgi:hypothetical protein
VKGAQHNSAQRFTHITPAVKEQLVPKLAQISQHAWPVCHAPERASWAIQLRSVLED